MHIPTGFEPMLASPLKDGAMPSFPCLASPKLDGVRAVVFGGVVYSRKLKPIPNRHVQALFGTVFLEGVDGELIVGDPTAPTAYRDTMSGVMSEDGEPNVIFHVFDVFKENGGFGDRFERLRTMLADLRKSGKKAGVQLVPQMKVNSAEELEAFEQKALDDGYEGAMVRSLNGPYKFGRSTVKEGYLLKVKRFCDAEATVICGEELEHNRNEATTNELGRSKRSSHKAGKVAGGTLGNLRVVGVKGGPFDGIEFSIGSGLDAATRGELWAKRDQLAGKIVKFRYFPTGSKERPRFPVFLGFRHPIDT